MNLPVSSPVPCVARSLSLSAARDDVGGRPCRSSMTSMAMLAKAPAAASETKRLQRAKGKRPRWAQATGLPTPCASARSSSSIKSWFPIALSL